MFFLYETYNFFYYLIKLIVIQPQYICVYMIFFFFNAGIAYSITNDIEDQVCRWLLFVSMLHALMIPPRSYHATYHATKGNTSGNREKAGTT